MTVGRLLKALIVAASMTGVAAVDAQPAENVLPGRHPNLAAAQRLTSDAYRRVVAAQHANEYDLGGHAERARRLLEEAGRELGAAAAAADRR